MWYSKEAANNFNCIPGFKINKFTASDRMQMKGVDADTATSRRSGWEVATHAPPSAEEGDYPAAFGWWLIKTLLALILSSLEGTYLSSGGYKIFFLPALRNDGFHFHCDLDSRALLQREKKSLTLCSRAGSLQSKLWQSQISASSELSVNLTVRLAVIICSVRWWSICCCIQGSVAVVTALNPSFHHLFFISDSELQLPYIIGIY